MGSSSRNTSSYYVTHPTSVVDYDDEYQQDDIQTNPEDPLAFAMNSSNTGRNNRRAYVQEEVIEGSNETKNVQRNLRTSPLGNTSTVQCYNCSGKGYYARNYPKPRVQDLKYFMEQMLLEKQDEARVILTDEQNDFLFADASRLEEIKDLSANICLMARIQPTNNTSDAGPSYDSAFIIEVQSSSINENKEQIQINALYKDFVPQKELSAEQKYFPSSFIPSDKTSNATTSIPASMPNNSLHAEIEQIKWKSIEIKEGLQARIKILEKMFKCEKQSVDFKLKLQHEKETHKWDSTLTNNNTKSLDYSWISKMEKLEHENVSLDFKVQSLIKERDNLKMEYQM
uniref:CCHC-type domain-containing protein n=1 Tax=Tanacetum cinerariifolium TaxID=118510 RepID=A0A699IYT3_TANCI|nr:hypothetical protein [Tanacetum cinerariifolium]